MVDKFDNKLMPLMIVSPLTDSPETVYPEMSIIVQSLNRKIELLYVYLYKLDTIYNELEI